MSKEPFYTSQLQVVASNQKQTHRFQGDRHVTWGRGQLQEVLHSGQENTETRDVRICCKRVRTYLVSHHGQQCEKKRCTLIKETPFT